MAEKKKLDKSYWAVIPGHVLYDKDLSPNAKLLYGVLSSLAKGEDKEMGYCWAENATLAAWFGASERQISRLVMALEDQGYIHCEMASTTKGSERRIYVGIFPGHGGIDKNVYTPGGLDKNVQGGLDKNVGTHIRNDSNTVITPPNPPKGKSGRKPSKKKEPESDWLPDRFEAFWRCYPHDYRGNKQRARRAWNKLRPEGDVLTAMGRALKRWMRSERWLSGIGIPNASTYISPDNGYWELADAERPVQAPVAASGPSTVVESRYEKL